MEFVLRQSLKHIVLVKISATLWNQNDIRDLIKKICVPFNSDALKDEWPKIEDRVTGKISQLLLPEILKEEILGLVKPIGSQILRWLKYHGDSCFNINLPNKFSWTPQGTIDEKKTGEMLIKDESIDISSRYKMSCIYCLEDHIPKLWNKIPEDCRKSFYNEKDSIYVKQQELVVFWTYGLKKEFTKMENMIEKRMQRVCSPYRYAFECAANDGCKVAIECFLQKLTSCERKEALLKAAASIAYVRLDPSDKHTKFLYEYYSDILCLLLTHMNEEQQMEVFKNFPCQVLMCFLDWPWQILYEKLSNHLWNFLPARLYDILLSRMTKKVIYGFKDFDYLKLFQENWLQSPDAHKRGVLNGYTKGYLILNLFKIKDENNRKMIFQDATLLEKRSILYSHGGLSACEYFMDNEEWDLLKFFIQECALLKKDIKPFKKFVMRCTYKDEFKRKKKNWNKLFRLLNDIASGFNKRKGTVANSCRAKRQKLVRGSNMLSRQRNKSLSSY